VSPPVALYADATQRWHLFEAEACALLGKLPAGCASAIVCDPPYGIGAMGEEWDGTAIRAAAGTRDPAEAFERWTERWASAALRVLVPGGYMIAFGAPRTFHRLVCGVEDAGWAIRDRLLWLNGQGFPKSRRLADGQGTALKPAYEPILLARKPLAAATTPQNIERFGTGALNIEATRTGRRHYWPANVVTSHSRDCSLGVIDGEPSGPSRLFYCAKASGCEREAGCEQLPARARQLYTGPAHPPKVVRNTHPTVKPLALMRWLVRLVTPPGGLVLDLFAGSGSTGVAAVLEGREFLGIERDPEYVDIACARLHHWAAAAAQEGVVT
jgi:DNA modification methylase